MNQTAKHREHWGDGSRRPFGGFLDDLPKGLYAAAHIAFLAVGVWLLVQARANSLPFAGALALYIVSQAGFLAYFANLITLKMAVLAEQMLVPAMLVLIVTA